MNNPKDFQQGGTVPPHTGSNFNNIPYISTDYCISKKSIEALSYDNLNYINNFSKSGYSACGACYGGNIIFSLEPNLKKIEIK